MIKKESEKYTEENTKIDRRKFLKKTMYAAPSLVVMGSLMRPAETEAGVAPTGPPSSPNSWPTP